MKLSHFHIMKCTAWSDSYHFAIIIQTLCHDKMQWFLLLINTSELCEMMNPRQRQSSRISVLLLSRTAGEVRNEICSGETDRTDIISGKGWHLVTVQRDSWAWDLAESWTRLLGVWQLKSLFTQSREKRKSSSKHLFNCKILETAGLNDRLWHCMKPVTKQQLEKWFPHRPRPVR